MEAVRFGFGCCADCCCLRRPLSSCCHEPWVFHRLDHTRNESCFACQAYSSESVAAQFVPAGAVRAGVMYGQDRIIEWSAAGSTRARRLILNCCGCAALRKNLVVEAAQVRFWLARGEAQKCSRGVVLVCGCLRCANCMGLAPWLWLVVCDRGSSRQISEQSCWPFNRSFAQTKERCFP